MTQVLRLDIAGTPQAWISHEEAACHYFTDNVSWTVGEVLLTLHGGVSRLTGVESSISVHPIIAVRGAADVDLFRVTPSLCNRKLFRRDRNTCAYCGEQFADALLTRDHIKPLSRGGQDTWMNVVAACRHCNQTKGASLTHECHMPLLYVPYVPSRFEDFILSGRNIRADVHEWLLARVPRTSRLHS